MYMKCEVLPDIIPQGETPGPWGLVSPREPVQDSKTQNSGKTDGRKIFVHNMLHSWSSIPAANLPITA